MKQIGKWLLPFKRNERNYENIGCMPYCLEHDRGFAGDKLYRVVRRLPDGGFVRILAEESPFYSRVPAVNAVKARYAEVTR